MFGQTLIKELRRIGMTVTEFANKMDVSAKTVYSWINGKNNPYLYNLKKMAKVFGCDLDSLLKLF